MKKVILFLLLCSPIALNAQVIAGVVPNGSTKIEPNQLLFGVVTDFQDTVMLDLDCDNVVDITIALRPGNMWSDVPSKLWAFPSDSNLFLCYMDTNNATPNSRVSWHSEFDTISCTGNYKWQSETYSYINNYGWGFLLAQQEVFINPGQYNRPPYFAVDPVFLGYKKRQVDSTFYSGWIEFQFDLTSNYSATAKLISYTTNCSPVGLSSFDISKKFKIYPTIVHNEIVVDNVSERGSFKVEIINSTGQVLQRKSFKGLGKHQLYLNNLSTGLYFLKVETTEGSQVFKIMKD